MYISKLKNRFPLSLRDSIISILIFAAVSLLCSLLHILNRGTEYVSMLFILAVFLISRFTSGFFYGILSSFISVLAVNFFFTYPYFQFNFTLSGYPLSILCMLAVSVITCTMTASFKQHESLRIEAEREKTRSNLLRAVSHDLRTPLTSILGSSSAIIENDAAISAQDRIRLLSEIREDARWLIRMVENLLSVTRIDGTNDAHITKYPEAVEELISSAVAKFKKQFPEAPISVQVPSKLMMVPMDAILIEQVIINLLENAMLHSGTATQINLSVYHEAPFARFEVRDNGNGISEKVLPHIFDGYFNQAYEDRSDFKRNMGIGLSVCYTIIKAHNGTMTAQNLDCGGACFCFTLPLEDR